MVAWEEAVVLVPIIKPLSALVLWGYKNGERLRF
jgi:hypothetical protein